MRAGIGKRYYAFLRRQRTWYGGLEVTSAGKLWGLHLTVRSQRITRKLMETGKDSEVRKSRLGRGVTFAQRVETVFPRNLSPLNEVKEKLMSFPVHLWGH